MHTKVREIVLAFVITMAIVFGLYAISQMASARADYNMGCERVTWGTFGSGWRDICDGPKRPDGSWDRTRREWTPAHWYTPYCSSYAWVCPAPRWVGESTQSLRTYPVTDDTVPQGDWLTRGEPGWLPPGTFSVN